MRSELYRDRFAGGCGSVPWLKLPIVLDFVALIEPFSSGTARTGGLPSSGPAHNQKKGPISGEAVPTIDPHRLYRRRRLGERRVVSTRSKDMLY